ncbi:glucuronate isomerase, partial [Nocardioides hankookensis]
QAVRPVRAVHLGLGAFFRAHQAWYTDRAPDADDWGIAAFTGRSATLAERLRAQDCAYTLVTRAPDGPTYERIHRAAYDGTATAAEATAYRRHLLLEMARMSTEDGLVMTLHPGIRRNHHTPTLDRFGPDQGHDLPLAMEYTDALRPLLERYGLHPDLHLVLFTVDETVFSREIAPLAGFYPSVYVGAPWWFLDAPDAIRRWRSAVTETVGFSKLSGFVDDTRAFCSIPARHDMARRLDAGYLAQLVVEHRLAEDEAHETIRDLVDSPRRAFKL